MHPLFTPTCFLNLFHGGRGTYCILFCSIGIKLLISQVYHTILLYLSTNNQFTALFQLSIIPNSNSLKYVPHEQNIHFSNGRLFQNQKSIALKIHTCVRKSTFGHGTFFRPVFGIKNTSVCASDYQNKQEASFLYDSPTISTNTGMFL